MPESSSKEKRFKILTKSGYNTLSIPAEKVEYDLQTDSWSELAMSGIRKRTIELFTNQEPVDYIEEIKRIFPFEFILPVAQGRLAEAFCAGSLGKRNKKAVQNLLFPTTRYHFLNNRLMPVEIPRQGIWENNDVVFKGDLDIAELEHLLTEEESEIAIICLEVCNNAAGGYPLSISNLKAVRELTRDIGVLLFIDVTRIVENAVFIQEYEDGFSNTDLISIIHKICKLSDGITASLTKDFSLAKGGIIATNIESVFSRSRDQTLSYGTGLNILDRQMIGQGIKNWEYIESGVRERMKHVKMIHHGLHFLKPLTPAGGHCLLLDLESLPLPKLENPVQSFLAWLYYHTGVRGGAHLTGMERKFSRKMIRFAIPVGMKQNEIDEIIQRLKSLTGLQSIPGLVRDNCRVLGLAGELKASYQYSAGRGLGN
jgi:polyketide synthase PksN